ncbi:MAG: DUF3638 domain-containing protein [Chlamydiales bacterium]|nr:DUF3638 domain-containing protein [Chlamydiales bacterium]
MKLIVKFIIILTCTLANTYASDTLRYQEIISNTDPVSVDDSLFLHALGDIFGGGSGLEGNHPIRILNYHEEVLSQLRDYLDDTSDERILIDRILKGIPEAKELATILDRGDASSIKKAMEDHVLNLERGQSIFCAGGWGQHAVVYEFTRQQDNRFTFRIFNTGEGVHYHPSYLTEQKTMTIPWITMENIKAEKLTHPLFTRALWELRQPAEQEITAADFYHTVLGFLEGTLKSEHFRADDLQIAQTSGTCTYASLISYYTYLADKPIVGRRLSLLLQIKALHDYFLNYERFSSDSLARNLARKALTHFANTIDDSHLQGIISTGERSELATLLSGFDQQLQRQQQQAQLDEAATAQHVITEPWSHLAPNIWLSPEKPVKVSAGWNTVNGDQSFVAIPSPLVWLHSEEDCKAEQLSTFVKLLKSANEQGQYQMVEVAIQELALALPLNTSWEHLTHDEAQNIIASLRDVTKEKIRSNYLRSEKNVVPHDVSVKEYLALIKLLAVSESLIRQFEPSLAKTLPALAPHQLRVLMAGDDYGSPLYPTYDPKWDAVLQEVSQYWKGFLSSDEGDFFDFSTYPAGNLNPSSYRFMSSTLLKRIRLQATVQPWDSASTPPFVEWTQQWVASTDAQAAIKANKPEIANELFSEQAMRILADRDILPSTFFDLRDISFYCDYLLTAYFSNSTKYDFDQGVEFIVEGDSVHVLGVDTAFWRTRYNVFGENPSTTTWNFSDKPKSHCDKEGVAMEWVDSKKGEIWSKVGTQHCHLDRAQEDWESIAIRELFATWGWNPHLYLQHRKNDPKNLNQNSYPEWLLKKLNLDEIRKIEGIASVPELQPIEVLAAFKADPSRLEKSEYRQLFKRLLFQPLLLRHMVNQSAERAVEFAEQAAEFTRSNYLRYVTLQDFDTAIFVAEMWVLLSHYLESYRDAFPEGHELSNFDARSAMKALLKDPKLPPHEKSHVARILTLTFRSQTTPLTSEELAEMMSVVILAKTDSRFKDEVDSILYSRRDEMEQLLNGPDRQSILDAIVHEHSPNLEVHWQWQDAEQTGWRRFLNVFAKQNTSSFPTYLGKGDTPVYLNVMEGKLALGGAVTLMSKNVHDILKDCLASNELELLPTTMKTIGPEAFEVVMSNGDKYILDRINSIVQKETPSGTYRLQNSENIQMYIRNIPLIKEHLIWYRESPKPQLLFIDKVSGETRFEAEGALSALNFFSSDLKVKAIRRFNSSDNLVLTLPISFFTRIEDQDYLFVWNKDKTNAPIRAEYPRLNLELFVEDGHWLCDSYPGYALTSTQLLPGLDGFSNYLVFENLEDPSKRMAIMPLQQSIAMMPTKSESSLVPKFVPDRNTDLLSQSLTKYKVVSYDVDTDGSLHPHTEEARFYLAYVLLWQQHYELAAKTLRGYGTALSPFNEGNDNQSAKTLMELSQLIKTNLDHDPRASAVRLLASYLLWKESKNFPAPGKIVTLPQSDYLVYLQNSPKSSWSLLKVEEELNIVQALLDAEKIASEIATERIRDLKLQLSDPLGYANRPSQDIAKPLSQQFANQRHDLPELSKQPVLLQKLLDQPTDGRPSLLRPNLTSHFRVLYLAARGNDVRSFWQRIVEFFTGPKPLTNVADRDALIDAIQLMTGTPVPNDLTTQEAVGLWREVLLFSLNAPIHSPADLQALQVLWAVTHHPLAFPPSEQLVQDSTFLKENLWDAASTIYNALWTAQKAPHKPQHTITTADKCTLRPDYNNSPDNICSLPHASKLPDLISDVASLIIQQPLADERREKLSQITGELLQVFQDTDLHQDINEYGIKALETEHTYEVVNQEGLSELAEQLKETLKEIDLEKLSVEILEAANKGLDDPLQRIGETLHHLTIAELARLYATQDISLLQLRNPSLSMDEGSEIFQKIGNLMALHIHTLHVKRIINLINQYQLAPFHQQTIATLYEELTAIRAYCVGSHPAYLSFEYFMGIMLKPAQVKVLDTLAIHNGRISDIQKLGAVIEMIMGAGKSSVILPLLGQLIADGERLAVVVMPEPLLPTMSENLQQTLGDSFGMGVEVIHIDRYVGSLDLKAIDYLLQRFEFARDQRKVVAMTNSGVQSLFLSFLARQQQHQQLLNSGLGDAETEAILASYRKIFQLLRRDATVVIDEIDLVMDVLKAHFFSTGEPEAIHPDTLVTTVGIYQLLAQKDISHVTQRSYDAEIKPSLVEAACTGQLLPDDTEFQNFVAAHTEELRDYLNNTGDANIVSKTDNIRLKNIVSVLFEQLNSVLPLTLRKHLNVHYGPSPQRPWAIPYHLGRPVAKSDFGTELEMVNYTLQMYLENGISLPHVKLEIDRLRNLAIQEYSQAQADMEFARLGSDLSLFTVSEADYPALLEAINASKEKVLEIATRFALSAIKTYPSQISTNAQIYPLLFNQVHGFTGTLWNYDTFPKAFEAAYPSDTQARTLHVLWETTPKDILELAEGDDEDLVHKILSGTDKLTSIIDSGGIFRKSDPQDIAKYMLQASTANGVIFYNAHDELMVLEDGADNPIPMGSSKLTSDGLIAFWDQSHTTGSDLKLHPEMHAIVTICMHTTMRDFLQGVWRLRGLGQGQSISIAMLQTDVDLIAETTETNAVTCGDALRYLFNSQVQKSKQHNQRAVKHQMGAVLIKKALTLLIDSENVPFQQVESLFSTQLSGKPCERYGKQTHLMPTTKVLADYQKRLLTTSATTFFGNMPELEDALNSIVQDMLPKMPAFMLSEDRYQREVSIEIDQEQEQEQEIQQEQTNSTIAKGWTQANWQRSGFFSSEYYSISDDDSIIAAVWDGCSEFWHTVYHAVYMSAGFGDTTLFPTGFRSLHDVTGSSQFDKSILVTSNLHPSRYAAFSSAHEEPTQMLVVQEKASGSVSLVLLTHHDARQVEQLLIDERTNPTAFFPKGVRLALYNIDTGITLHGSEPIEKATFVSPRFNRLKTQVKFYRGDTMYTKAEREMLVEWTQNHDDLRDLFLNEILPQRPTKKRLYHGSVIHQILR